MTHLYELSNAYKMLMDTDELTEEELIECVNNVKELFNDKARNIARLVLSLKADSEAIATEVIRLSARKQAIENRMTWLKNYLTQEMEATETTQIKDEIVSVSLRNSPPSVMVEDEELIPADYWRTIPETKVVDKQTILGLYKEDNSLIVPGVTIQTDRKHVVIR